MKQFCKRYFPLLLLALALLIGGVVFLTVQLRRTAIDAVEGYIRASREYDAHALVKYASDYQVTALSGNGDLTREALEQSLALAYEEASIYRETGKLKFVSEVKEEYLPGSERFEELLETYSYKADPKTVSRFALVSTTCYIDGKKKSSQQVIAVKCDGRWYYGFLL